MRFVEPQVLFALPLILPFLWWARRGRLAQRKSIGFSSLYLLEWSKAATPLRLRHRIEWLHLLFWTLLLLALARPQLSLGERPRSKEGIDIILCLDTSTSMEAQDLRPNRIEAAKSVSEAFIESRPDDRIGLVIYAGIALTQCPLTTDHQTLKLLLRQVHTASTGLDGTAIGNAIATSVNRLKDLPGDSKVIVLLTDGRNNAGQIEPVKAAELAAELGIRVYAIGVGTDAGGNPMFGADFDMDTLIEIANATGAKAFRASNTEGLKQIYDEIDQLEKSEHEEKPEIMYQELMVYPASGALLVLLFLAWQYQRRQRA